MSEYDPWKDWVQPDLTHCPVCLQPIAPPPDETSHELGSGQTHILWRVSSSDGSRRIDNYVHDGFCWELTLQVVEHGQLPSSEQREQVEAMRHG